MTTPQPPSAYAFDNRAQRWRNPQTGQFVAEATVISEMQALQQATIAPLQNMTSQLYAGHITLEQWQIAAAAELKDAHLALSLFAIGGKGNATQSNYGRVGATLKSQYQFLDQFARDIAAGGVSEAQARARIAQYGRATQQSFWREYDRATPEGYEIWWVLHPAEHCGDCLGLAAGSPYEPGALPTHPGAGDTACRGNCKCTEERRKKAA